MIKIIETKRKTSKLMADFKNKFDVYCYWNDKELDKNFPAPEELTTREFSEDSESSYMKGSSWNEMDKEGMMTFREYILFFVAYHEKTGKYPDEIGWTIFKDRLPDGYVAGGYWGPDVRRVGFDWSRPGTRHSNGGGRVAINPLTSTLVPSAIDSAIQVVKAAGYKIFKEI